MALGASCGMPRPGCAQTNERAYESLEFRTVTPGARAVAMGKTFVGIADDATAAASNPAGLSNLLDPEISIEWSATDNRHTRIVSSDILSTQTFAQTVAYPSFASIASPLPDVHGLGNVTVAAFYNSLQRYREQYLIPNNDLSGRPNLQGGFYGSLDIGAEAYGFGGSVLVSRTLSIGGALTVQHLSFDVDSNSSEGFSPPGQVIFRSGTTTNDSDTAISGQLGVLFKPLAWLALGAAVNPGTTFHLTTTIHGTFTSDGPGARTADVSAFKNPVQPIDYRIPTRYTIGASARPTANLTLVGDVGWVKYSQRVTSNFLIVDQLAKTIEALSPDWYYVDDAIEWHTGAEYRLLRGGHTIAFRAGLFTDPDHQMRFDSGSVQNDVTAGQARQFDRYFPGTVIGVTGGGGVVLKNRVQIDGAVSWSANERQVVVSSVIRFPR